MEQLAKLGPLAALSRLWHDLSPGQRAMVAAFIALSIAVAGFAAVIASKPRMSVLFSNLESTDAGAIAQKLDEDKVPYQISGDGSTIEVPSGKVYDLRLKMASQGLPEGGTVGFEQFDKGSFGMTEFTERVTYQRALQGELTRTICRLAPVTDARVMVVLPEERVYASEQSEPTASVFLKLRRGVPLSDGQVAGIVHLVSSAVEGLKPSNVTVVDSSGNVLAEPTLGGSSGSITANQTKMKRQYESALAANLQSMLAQITGPDKSVVRVSAELDFDQKQETSETYEPAGGRSESRSGVLQSEESTTETFKGNVNPPADSPARNPGESYELNKTNTQYRVSKRIQETVTAPGQVKRLSVAVILDDSVPASKIGAVQEAVMAAAGLDPNPPRNDLISVQRMAFEGAGKAGDAELATASRSDLMMSLARNGGAVLLLVVFLVFLRSIVNSIRVQAPGAPAAFPMPEAGPAAPAPTPPGVPQSAPSMPASPQAGPAAPAMPAAPSASRVEVPPEIAQSDPEDLAKLVRNWMTES